MKAATYTSPALHFFFSIGFLLAAINPLHSQQKNFPLNREWGIPVEKWDNVYKEKKDTVQYYISHYQNLNAGQLRSCFKPYNEHFGTFVRYTYRSSNYLDFYPGAKRKIFDESLFIIKDTSERFFLTIDPLFNFEYGRDFKDMDKKERL